MASRLKSRSFPVALLTFKQRRQLLKQDILQSRSTLFRRPRKAPCNATMLSEPAGQPRLRSRSLALEQGCVTLRLSSLVRTKNHVRRFNRYIFFIKYIMFLYYNCCVSIGTRIGADIITFDGRGMGIFLRIFRPLGLQPLCLAVSPGAAVPESGLLTFLCTSGVPELTVSGNSIVLLI